MGTYDLEQWRTRQENERWMRQQMENFGLFGNETQSSHPSSETKTTPTNTEQKGSNMSDTKSTSFPAKSSKRETMTAAERKAAPIYSGVVKYFPDALFEVAHLSKVGNDQHNPGEPLHWAKEKSTDEGDALLRHQVDAGTRDTDGVRHSAKVAWRALAQLQREIDAERMAEQAEWQDGQSL